MLSNEITTQVDLLNTGVTTERVISRYDELPGRSTYIFSEHTPAKRHMVTFSRSQPKRAGNFKGVGKSSVKFTEDVDVPGFDSATNVSAPIIAEVSFSIPVGTDPAAILVTRQMLIAMLDNDSVMDQLNIQLMV
jgi:hypothetical protein